jgi:hypothetical protein
MSCGRQDLIIQKGKTFSRVIRWESEPFIYKAITAITKAAPAVITAVGHGVPNNWRVAIVSVQGMTEINAEGSPPRTSDFTRATVLTVDTIALNEVNSAEFSTYTSGGFVQFYTPVDLTAFTARMQIRQSETSSTILLDLNTTNGRIVIDNVAKTITLTVTAVDTALITWKTGVYDLELVSPAGVVTQLLKGTVTVEGEVTV